jgi:hypothetical protein
MIGAMIGAIVASEPANSVRRFVTLRALVAGAGSSARRASTSQTPIPGLNRPLENDRA